MRTFLTMVLALVPAMAWADPICAYVIGEVGGQSFSTPAVPIYVPDTMATVQPVRVHVDPTTQTILGYSVRTPGAEDGLGGRIHVHAHRLHRGHRVRYVDRHGRGAEALAAHLADHVRADGIRPGHGQDEGKHQR